MKHRMVLAAALMGALVGCHSGGSAKNETATPPVVDVSAAPAVLGSIRSTLSVTGTAAPLPNEEVKLAPLAPGRIAKVFVKVGDHVHIGEVIAVLDPGPTAGQVQQAQAAVRSAEAALQQARISLANQATAYAQDVRQAELNVEAQQIALQKLRSGSRPQEIDQARAAVASAQAALTNAQQNLSRSRTLFSEGLLARKDLEAAQAAETTAQAALSNARQGLSMARQGSRPEDIRAGEVALAAAKQQLSVAKSHSNQRQLKKQDVLSAEAQLQAARGGLEAASASARSLTITSPVAGQVSGRAVNPGESVDVTSTIVTIVNLNQVRVLLNVPAAEIASVKVGDPVTITTDSASGKRFPARITVVSQAADANTNTVPAEAVAPNSAGALRDNAFIRASITTAVHLNAVLVPSGAVTTTEGKTYVFVVGQDGTAHRREIKVGAQEGGRVEALAGISAGDEVVTTGSYELDDGTKIKVTR